MRRCLSRSPWQGQIRKIVSVVDTGFDDVVVVAAACCWLLVVCFFLVLGLRGGARTEKITFKGLRLTAGRPPKWARLAL